MVGKLGAGFQLQRIIYHCSDPIPQNIKKWHGSIHYEGSINTASTIHFKIITNDKFGTYHLLRFSKMETKK